MSMATRRNSEDILFLQITQGNLVQKVKESNPDAVKREYTLSSGAEGVTYEIPYQDVSGHITGIKVEKGKYGTQVKIHLAQDMDKAIIALPYESDYFSDFAKRIAGADLSKPVTLIPYEIEEEGRKYPSRGVAVHQGEKKLKNFFYDTEKKKTINKFPDVSKKESEKYDTEDWKLHFAKCRKFLKDVVESLEFPKYDGVVDTVEQESPKKMATATPVEAFDPPAETPEGVQKLPWEK